jgi:hypothetical protein
MTTAADLPSDGADRNDLAQPEPAVHRAIAGVYEGGFREGWGETIPWYPSYRSLRCGEALCVLTPPSAGDVWLQVHLFVHAETHEPPRLTCTDGTSTWAWKLTTGWLTLHHELSSKADVMELRFAAEEQADTPWWEFRVNEVSLLDPFDPRLRRL